MDLPTLEVSQTPKEKFREYLASGPRPQRFTRQHADMVDYIFSKHNHFAADQLIDEIRQEGLRISRATVYRTLKKLVDAGLLRELEIGQVKYYEHDYGYPQHEHLVCQKCHKMIEFQYPGLDAMIREVCRQHQFQMDGHSFVIRGLCADCNRSRMMKRRLDLV
ncbi:MAG: transcriptional repressor [Gemmataceae bacterium]|nr:transcriptional repressor [Gemmataceae bacterium]MCI0738933.1 transcriptional repressor [Gemmataceae bacterium]